MSFLDDHFPDPNDEQMSNNVRVEHQPGLLEWESGDISLYKMGQKTSYKWDELPLQVGL